MDKEIADALSYSPIEEAEKLLGKNHADAPYLGLALHIDHNKKKTELLKSRGDTTMGMVVEDYQAALKRMGFVNVLERTFKGASTEETQFIYARRDGLLLVFDTYTYSLGDHKVVNQGNVYYNWHPSDPNHSRVDNDPLSSGSYVHKRDAFSSELYEPTTWAGSHDAREALRFKLDNLVEKGCFVTPWVQPPFMWLLDYAEAQSYGGGRHDPNDYLEINRGRIAQLPDWVQKMVGKMP